jgi:hypothetical protein
LHQAAASSFAVQVSAAPVHGKDEIEGVVAAQARDPGGGLFTRKRTWLSMIVIFAKCQKQTFWPLLDIIVGG